MRIQSLFGGKALAVALAVAMLPASIAIPQSTPLIGPIAAVPEASAQYYRGGRHHYRGGRHWRGDRGYRHYRGHRYHRRGGSNAGAAIGGAIAGLAVGALIAGASQPRYVERRYIQRAPAPAYYGGGYGRPAPWTSEWYRYCSSRYRSFDARSGTFQPYHGPRQLCQ